MSVISVTTAVDAGQVVVSTVTTPHYRRLMARSTRGIGASLRRDRNG